MKRGDIVTVAAGRDFGGKPRPAVVIQDEKFDSTQSLTVCLFTTNIVDALFRVHVEPTAANGLIESSSLMADKIMSLPLRKVGRQIGRLSDDDMVRLSRALAIFLQLI